MSTFTVTQSSPAVRSLSPDVMDLVINLTGFHPSLNKAITALTELLSVDLTDDQTQSLIAALGGTDDDFMRLVTLVIRDLGNPATNPAVAKLTKADRNQARRLTAAYAAQTDLELRRDLLAEAAAAIDPTSERA